MPGLARRLPRGVRARAARRRRLRPAPAAPRHEPDDRARAEPSSSRPSRPDGGAGRPARGRPTLPLQRQRLLRARVLGGDPLPRRRLRRGPGVRRATCSRAGWTKVYHPGAAVLHAHDYGPLEFMRRYFDEYRGLRETTGHVEPLRLRGTLGLVGADLRWMSDAGLRRRAACPLDGALARPPRRPADRRAGSARAPARLPGPLRRRLSLEGRGDARRGAARAGRRRSPRRHAGVARGAGARRTTWRLRCVRARGADAAARPGARAWPTRERLRIAMILPPFRRGSGGHNTLLQILTRLERRGHVCSVWVHDVMRMHQSEWPGVLRWNLREFFAPIAAPVYKGFDAWQGADVVDRDRLADGVPGAAARPVPRARLRRQRPRARVLRRPRSSASLAEDTYRQGLHCIAASPWLRDLLVERYGASADAFEPGRRARHLPAAADRAPRGHRHLLRAPRDAAARRPDRRWRRCASCTSAGRTRGSSCSAIRTPLETAFPYEHLGVLQPEQLSWLYSQATVGLCLSMTNFSLMPKEMLACGLPCVELAGVSAESIFGTDGPIELAELDPVGARRRARAPAR